MVKSKYGVLDYERAAEIIKDSGRMIAGLAVNTYLWEVHVERERCYEVIFHVSPIIRFYSDGRVKLWSGGWRTLTTRGRINQFQSAVYLYTRKGNWWVALKKIAVPFHEGLMIREGTVDVLATLGIEACPITWDFPGIAADWLEENRRDQEAERIREYVRQVGLPEAASPRPGRP
jgi:hypothetical protein